MVTDEDQVMLSCGPGPEFSVSALEGGVTGLAEEAEVVDALERLAAEAGIEAPQELQRGGIADGEWIVLGRETDQGVDRLIVGVGSWDGDGPGDDGEYVILDHVNEHWRASAWGGCNLAPVLAPGVSWAQITVTPQGLDPAAMSLPVKVYERECTSGRDPEPFLNEPVVVESDRTVTVYWTSDTPQGGRNCPGNPSVRKVVSLDEPLRDRRLLDGSTWPPRPVSGS